MMTIDTLNILETIEDTENIIRMNEKKLREIEIKLQLEKLDIIEHEVDDGDLFDI